MKLVGNLQYKLCDTCKGKGFVPMPTTYTTRPNIGLVKVPGSGSPTPCPDCRGKKVLLN